MLELSTDPQFLIHSLGYIVLQKLYIHQLESPAVNDLYPRFLLSLASMPKFPILTSSICRQLLKANSFMKFKRLLRSLLIEHFVDNRAAGVLAMTVGQIDIIEEYKLGKVEARKLHKEMTIFLDVKRRWRSNLEKFACYFNYAPELQPRSLEELYSDFILVDKPDEAACYVELSGALLSQTEYGRIVEYFQLLVQEGQMPELNFQSLLEELSRLQTYRKKGSGNVCRGWINVAVLKYLSAMVREELCSPDQTLKRFIDPGNIRLFVADTVGDLDPDIQSEVVEQLLRPSMPSSIIPIQQLEDISLVSYIILRKPKDLELNSAFTTFVQIKSDQPVADEGALSEYQ